MRQELHCFLSLSILIQLYGSLLFKYLSLFRVNLLLRNKTWYIDQGSSCIIWALYLLHIIGLLREYSEDELSFIIGLKG